MYLKKELTWKMEGLQFKMVINKTELKIPNWDSYTIAPTKTMRY